MKKVMMIVTIMFLSSPIFAYENASVDCSALADGTTRDVKVINSTNSSTNASGTSIVAE